MSKISVTTIAGLTSGGDANKVKIESGDTLEVVNGSQTINRTGDGDLIAFQKGGVDSGSISIESSGTAFDGEGSHAGLKMFASAIGARQNGSDVDNTIDLGFSSGRFKDLYLGGGLYVGGTGAANHFDDYEEGTATITMIGSSSNPNTAVTVSARYVKIGRLVSLASQFSNVDTTGASGAVRLTGLPFTATQAHAAGNVMFYVRFALGGTSTNVSPYISGTQVQFYQSTSGAGWGEISHSAGTGAYLSFSVIYEATT